MRRDDNEGVNPAFARVLGPYLDTPIDLVPQHYLLPRAKRAACGGGWIGSASPYGVTCPACKTYLAKKTATKTTKRTP